MHVVRTVVGRAALATTSAVTLANLSIATYLGLLTAAGVIPHRRRDHLVASTRFAILVPAHDEESVIADTLDSLRSLDYDPALYDVHVVADNCSDRTADIVRASGWTAHERSQPEAPGKGPALNWLFTRVDASSDFDVAIIIDADTIVDPDFLRAMDRTFADGADVAQGYYSVRDPEATTAAAIRFAALACRHHLRPLGRTRLGASCGLYGNGMGFRRDILRRHRWTGHLVEDAEFQMELLLREGVRVRYVPEARIEAEMPSTLEAATSQNERWERGRAELAKRYVPQLVRRLPSAHHRRIAIADAIADHVVPPFSVVVAGQAAGFALTAGAALITQRGRSHEKFTRRALLHAATLGILGIHVISALRAVAAPAPVYRSLMGTPRAIAWKAALWARALSGKSDITWRRTRRNAETIETAGTPHASSRDRLR